MSETTSHDVLVIGAGVAGLSAAREALRAGLSVAYLEAQMFGGLILNVNELDGAITGNGAEFASNLMAEVAELGGENLEGVAAGVDRERDALVVTSDAGRHQARAVIVASGAALKKLGVPGEAELEHKGVSHCADCDGPMFQGQEVAVVGGGDSALQSALVLAKYCDRVHLIHRGDAFRAKPQFIEAVQAAGNIAVRMGGTVSEVLGTDGVEGARLGDGEVIPCSGFFAFVGLQPNSDFLPAGVRRDERGALVTSPGFESSMPGVYAAGAVRAGCGPMIEDAIAEGEAAARAVAACLTRV
jgi:thioredoxin reductase (NADPH)